MAAQPHPNSLDLRPRDVHRFLRRIQRQETRSDALILHYDLESRDLRPWLW